MSLRTITLNGVMALRPCRERETIEAAIAKYAPGRTEANALDLLWLPALEWSDCLWLLRGGNLIDDRIWQLWAIDCATRVLPHFEKRHPEDKRPREALVAASAYLLGQITLDELRAKRTAAAAATYAAYAAAAADDAAAAATYAAYAAAAAAYAAYAAAAATYADAAAARREERIWQRERLAALVEEFG